jgi:RimJ/RimL family protein N-acetyltransferase
VTPDEALRLLNDEVPERFRFAKRYPLNAIRLSLRVLLDYRATHSLLLVLAPEGDVIGHVSLDAYAEPHTMRVSLIEIADQAQRQGYGLEGLRNVQAWAGSRNVFHLVAQIAPDNAASRGVFARADFRPVPARPDSVRRKGAFDEWRWSNGVRRTHGAP